MANPVVSKPLHVMFTAVPPRYDLINTIITWGQDKRWRKMAARACLDSHPARMLDLGCGTGDLSVTTSRLAEGKIQLVGLDYSRPMLDIAQQKVTRSKANNVSFVHGNAAELPFPNSHFDCIGISFAFRNLTYRNPLTPLVLSEVLRVLSPGGRFVAVESSQPESTWIKGLFHLYLRGFVRHVGSWLSDNPGAYRYLAESASHFYMPNEVKELLLTAGFTKVSYRPLLFGAAGIYAATK